MATVSGMQGRMEALLKVPKGIPGRAWVDEHL